MKADSDDEQYRRKDISHDIADAQTMLYDESPKPAARTSSHSWASASRADGLATFDAALAAAAVDATAAVAQRPFKRPAESKNKEDDENSHEEKQPVMRAAKLILLPRGWPGRISSAFWV